MSEKNTYNWEESKIIDDIEFNPQEATEFADLLNNKETNREQGTISSMEVGHIYTGSVVELTADFVVVDVGLKSEGLIPLDEFSDPASLTLGGEVEVFLDKTEGEDGQIVLSHEKAKKQRQWEFIVNHCTEGSIVKGKVIRKVKGGLMVDIGMEAFLPGSQIDNKRIKNLDEFINEEYEFKILKINIERKNIVISRRELLEAERSSKRSELLDEIQEGSVKRGIVKNITDFGVFLDLDGIDGLLHITDMTWKRIRHPSEMVEMGQELDVTILSIDKERGRVALGLKQQDANPWADIEMKYPPGTKINGKIVNLVPYGAFIEIEPGIEGLIHVSEMSWTKNISDPSEVVNKGDEVEAIVLSIQKDEGKISLGIKQTENNPWEKVEEKYPIGKVVTAQIRNLTNYGAFVKLEPGIDGLIHISDISWTKKISHPSEALTKGEDVEAVILSVDSESKKITLGIKQMSDNPWESLEKSLPVGSTVTGVVTRLTAFGAFVELENGVEGLIHVSELSDKPFTKIEDILSVGETVSATVSKVDPEHKKISLSRKDAQVGGNQDDIVIGNSKS